ncbi:hypothetical protein HS088_TW16G00349 [Tripterygium wilfordii]|uniref:ASCH domain-containing protein n=1 Tax=Tripterygium wilfordii TaxID=458696 RepID=A0A7J7CIM0_TRIWF|nr:hypothetical protein HS088_TW16G00349 [Tripterygium wilfordii]
MLCQGDLSLVEFHVLSSLCSMGSSLINSLLIFSFFFYNLRIESGSSILFNKCVVHEVQEVRRYASFHEMLESEGLAKVLPGVKTTDRGVQVYRNFYTEEKERSNGVLAICVAKCPSQPYFLLAEILSGLRCDGVDYLLGLSHQVGTRSRDF